MLRAGRFDLIDIENVAEEIEDVGKSEQRELINRMATLLAHSQNFWLKHAHDESLFHQNLAEKNLDGC